MSATAINHNTSTAAVLYTTNVSNKLSDASQYKVQCIINEAKIEQQTTCKQIIYKRIISIYTKVKAKLSLSERTIAKLKGCVRKIGYFFLPIAINGAAIGTLVALFIIGGVGSIMGGLLVCPLMLAAFIFSAKSVMVLSAWRHQITKFHPDNILEKVRNLAKALDIPYKKSSDISMLFHLIEEIQDLSFMSGNSYYDGVREALLCYLKKNKKCIAPLLQHATKQDKKELKKILDNIHAHEHLSLDKMEECHALLEASTKIPEGDTNTKPLRMALGRKLLSDLPYLNEKIINASDKNRRFIGFEEYHNDNIIEIIDQPHQTGIERRKTQEIHHPIGDCIDKLHYTSRLCSLLNSCYPSLDSTQKIPLALCDQLNQCDIIYHDLRCQLSNTCSKAKKIWALGALVRQINRTWIERYRNQSALHDHTFSHVSPESICPISHLPFDAVAPKVNQADNIVIFDADNHLYSLDALMTWAKHQNSISKTTLPTFTSPATRRQGNLIDIIPISKIINIKKFTIENMLPVTLPLDFIQQQKEEETN